MNTSIGKISIGVLLDSHKNKDGLHQVYIRLTQNRRHKKIKVGLTISAKDWTGKSEKWVSSKNPDSEFYNTKIIEKLTEVKKANLGLNTSGHYINKETLYKEVNKKYVLCDFIAYWIKTEKGMFNYNQSKGYVSTRNKITAYINAESIDYRLINGDFLKGFEHYLREGELDSDTIYSHLKRIRATYNRGIDDEIFEQQHYPFRKYKMPKVEENRIEKLNFSELILLFQMKYEAGTKKFWVLNGFQVAFHCAGMRIEDLLTLKWKDVEDGRVQYSMKKGVTQGRIKNFLISNGLSVILAKMRASDQHNTGYILPFLSKGDEKLSSKEYKQQIGRKTTLYNKYLKEIAQEAGLKKRVSSHVVRHSWAKYVYEYKKNPLLVKQNLDHKKMDDTMNYIGRLSTEENDEIFREIDFSRHLNSNSIMKAVG